jgi:hypothetical protein
MTVFQLLLIVVSFAALCVVNRKIAAAWFPLSAHDVEEHHFGSLVCQLILVIGVSSMMIGVPLKVAGWLG